MKFFLKTPNIRTLEPRRVLLDQIAGVQGAEVNPDDYGDLKYFRQKYTLMKG
jgi:hypothetical protein